MLAAKDVYLDSRKGNLDLTAAEIVALNDITAFAEKDIVLGTAEDTETKSEKEIRKSSGLSASKSKGVASVGYSKNKSDMRDKNVATSIATTVLNSVSGNLTISSIHGDVTSNAARMNAGRDIAIEGNNVHLNAMTEHENNQFSYKSKSTGFGVSAVYNPVQVVKDNFGEQASQGSAAGIIGKILTAADAASKTANQLMNPGSPYFKTQKIELNKNTQKETAVIGHVDAGGNLSITAREGDITSQGSQLSAKGDGSLSAKRDVQLDVATSSTSQNNRSTRKDIELNASKGGGIYSEKDLGEGDTVTEQASVLSFGGNSSVTAKQGDVRLAGTQLVSEGDNRISAGGDVVLTTAEKRVGQSTSSKKHHIGEAVVSETERFGGYHRQLSSESHDSVSHSGATIASLNGNVDIEAGNDFHQTSGQILAKKRIDIEAEKVTFDVAHNTGTSSSHKSDLKMGTFARVGSPIIDLVQAVESAIENKEANDRVRAAQALGVAAKGYSAYANAAAGGALLHVEAGTGYSHSRERMESAQSEAQGNVVNAQHISVKSRSGDIQAKQTDFVSRDSEGNRLADSSITLDAHKDLIVESSQSTAKQKGKQQSSGVEVGAGVAVGAQTGAYIYVQGGFTKGKQDEQHVVQNNSHLDSETITLKSGGDTTLAGAVAKGKTINADVGGVLTVESRQDEHHSKSSSVGAGGRVQVALGTAWGGSGYGNASSGKSNSKQVVEQSGLFAEEGGYHVNADHVQLNGGAIASTNPNKSELSTNTLAFKNIENESESKALTGGMSVSANLNKLGNAEAASKEGAKQQADLAKLTGTTQSNGINPTVPMYDSESDSSVTKATLTEGKITLNKDSQPTETTAQALGLNTDLNQANKQVEATFDIKQKLKDQQVLSAAVGDIGAAAQAYTESKAKELNQEAEELEKAGKVAEAIQKKEEAEKWQTSGEHKRKVDAVTTAISLAIAGKPTEAVVAGAASPYVNQAIKQLTEQSETANIAAHVLWGAIEAELAGGKASTGAVAAGAAEIGARVLTQGLYEKEPHELTTEEKEEVLALSKALAGLASGAVNGGSSVETLNAVSTGVEVAKNAVENNYLSKSDWQNYEKDIQQCHGYKECIAQAKEKFSEINKQNSEILKSACQLGGNSSSCNEQTSLAKEGLAYARENIPFEMASVWQATMMRTTKKESEMKPSKALVGSETIEMLEKLSSNSQYQEMLANSQVEREKFRNQVDEATLDVRTEKGNAYEFGAYREYPNISSVGNYNYFGRELGLEPVYPEFYVLGGMGAKGLAKGINTISSTSTKVPVGINGAISAGSQYMVDGEINPKQVLWDMAEARITKDFSYKKFAVWNAGTGFVEGYSEKQNVGDGLISAVSKLSIASAGYGVGKKVEGIVNPYFNPYKNGFETVPAGLGGSITKYKPESIIPTGIGNLSENIFSKPLDYIKGNYENFKKDDEK